MATKDNILHEILASSTSHFPVTDSFFKHSEQIKERENKMILKEGLFRIRMKKTTTRKILKSCREKLIVDDQYFTMAFP